MNYFNFSFTKEKLQKILPTNPDINRWFYVLESILPKKAYQINTPLRVANFLAQTAHESGDFRIIKENLNYRAQRLVEIFPKYFHSLSVALQYEHKPDKIANLVYENRMGNGNEASGDGYKFCGRGLIQLTGKNNYTAFANFLGKSLEETIEYIETQEGALESACWYWTTNHLNTIADTGDIVKTRRIVNGGLIGLQDVQDRYRKAINILISN